MLSSEGLIDTLVSANPLEQSQRVLARLVSHVQATGGAILLAGEDGPVQWIGLNVRHVGDALAKWDRHVKALTITTARTADGITTALLKTQGRIVGMLYLEGAQTFDLERHAGYLEAFAIAAVFSSMPKTQGYNAADVLLARGARGNDDRLKDITLAALAHFEWNLARTARELQCTRRTLYQRLERWGIPRQRPARS